MFIFDKSLVLPNYNKNGQAAKTYQNISFIIDHVMPGLGFSDFDGNVYYGSNILGVDFTEIDVQCFLSEHFKLEVGKGEIFDHIITIAKRRAINPIADWIRDLPAWDGTSRFAMIADDILGAVYSAEDHQRLTHEFLKRYFISAIKRAFEPGCQHDNVLVLKGPTGARKSTFLSQLAPTKWFGSSMLEIDNKDGLLKLRGKWFYEFQEFKGFSKKDVNAVKEFITQREDEYREPYGRNNRKYPRTVLLTATTNDDEFLTDPTSNRRFWVVETGALIDVEGWTKIRDQVFAEAYELYANCERSYLTKDDESALAAITQVHEEHDDWTAPVQEFLQKTFLNRISGAEILTSALSISSANSAQLRRVRVIMKALGWSQVRIDNARYYSRPKAEVDARQNSKEWISDVN